MKSQKDLWYEEALQSIERLAAIDCEHQEIVNVLRDKGVAYLPLSNAEFSPGDFREIIGRLAAIDGSLALSFAMHLYTFWGLCITHGDHLKDQLFKIREQKKLLASLNEPQVYFVSPSGFKNGSYPLVAKSTVDGYVVTGIKRFVSFEPFADVLPAYCRVDGYTGDGFGLVALLLDKSKTGVSVDNDWRVISMRDTNSNSVKFDAVECPGRDVITMDMEDPGEFLSQGVLFRFAICCVYDGIARAVRRVSLSSIQASKVMSGAGMVSSKRLPGIQGSVAEIEISISTIDAVINKFNHLLALAVKSKDFSGVRLESVIAKQTVSRCLERVVHQGTKIVGIASLSEAQPISKLFLDAQAMRFHPPQEDVALELIGKETLKIISNNVRWA